MSRSRTRRKPPSPEPLRRTWLLPALIVVAISVAYANSLNAPFFLDDHLTILENPSIRDWRAPITVLTPSRELPVAGRPVVNATFALNHALGGVEVIGYHIVNVAIHLSAALLLFGVTRRTLALQDIPPMFRERSHWLAAVIALLWGVHPLTTEAVTYVTQRTESLMGLFLLLTLYASSRAHATGHRTLWTIVAIASCGLGMACKETMVVAPFLVLLYDRVMIFGSLKAAVRARATMYAGLAGTWIVLGALLATGPRIHSAGFSTGIGPWTYLLNQAPLILRYLWLAVWPHSLVISYGWPRSLTLSDVLPAMVVVSTLVAVTLVGLRYRPRAFFPAVWFFVTLAPASSIVPIATEVGAERRMYLPLIGVVAIVVLAATAAWDRWGLRSPHPSRAGAIAAFSIVALLTIGLSAGTVARNADFGSSLRLAQLAVDRYPTPVGRHLLGVELIAAGRREEGVRRLREAKGEAPRAHFNLGMELFTTGQLDEARTEFEAFIARQPMLLEVISARLFLGRIAGRQGRWEDAEAQYSTVLSMSPSHVEAKGLLGHALVQQQRFDTAVPLLTQFARARTNNVEAWNELGVALANMGRIAEATTAFARAVALEPAHAEALRNLATAYFDGGDVSAAAHYADLALAARPADPGIRELIEQIRARQPR